MLSNNNFKGQVILITGASHGIGKGCALKFASEGAIVIINYLKSKKAANEIVKTIEQSQKGQAIAIKADISKINQVNRMIKQTIKKFHRIDILINNAGVEYLPATWKDISPSNWNKTISTNLTGVFNCVKIVSPIMLKQKKGKIVNLSSVAGFTGSAQSPAYTASKAGVINLTQAFAKELGPYINVNSIAPGWTNTKWHQNQESKIKQIILKKTPLKRLGEIDDVVNAIEFLISEKSKFITGQTLIVDGGATLI